MSNVIQQRLLFQLNTIQRITETVPADWNGCCIHVSIKHYPTNNWNKQSNPSMRSPLLVSIKHYPTNNWNHSASSKNRCVQWFQLNTIQRITETSSTGSLETPTSVFQLNTIQRITETRLHRSWQRWVLVSIKHYPTNNWNKSMTAKR